MKPKCSREGIITIAFSLSCILGVFSVETAKAATPTIGSVSGTVSTGSTLTVTGANMVSENTTGWYLSAQKSGFEGASPSGDGWIMEDVPGSNVDGGYVTNMKLLGTKSLWLYDNVNCQAQISCGPNRVLEYLPVMPSTKYFSSYIRYQGSWPTDYMKMFITDGPDQWYFQPRPGGNRWWGKHGGLESEFTIPGGLQFGRWYHWEIELTDSSTDTMRVWMDGQLLGTWNHANQNTTWSWVEYGIPNWDGTAGPMNVWFDRFVYSSSRVYPASTIEVGNSSNYATATKKYQEPIILGDSSLQIKLDLTGLGSGPYYLFVTNNNQERSAAYTLSGGNDTTPPTLPANFNLSANATSSSSITVSWNPATDDVGVTGYIVERCQGTGCSNFTQVGTPTVSPFVDSGLTANTLYNYHVRATDAAGNLSGWSNVVGATTQAGTPAPTFTLTANPTSITSGASSTLTWSAVTNATSCTASGGTFTGSKSTSGGTQSVSPTSTMTYTLSCTGVGGTTNQSAPVAVTTGGGTGTTFLDENFDDANYSGYLDTSGGNNIDTATKHGGAGAFKCSFASSATKCTGNTSMRYVFPESESVYVSYWVKQGSSWTGSNRAYHPHIFFFLTNLDDEWSGFNGTRLTTYVEENEGVPLIAIQDSANINGLTNSAQPPTSGFGQNHSVAGCNGLFDGSSHSNTVTSCYWDGSEWNNDRGYKANQIYFSNTCPGPYCKTDWHHIEAYFRMNTVTSGNANADGVMQMWYDSTNILDYGNIMYRTGYNDTANGFNHATQKFREFAFSPYIGDGSPVAQDMWIDDLQVRDIPPTDSSFTPCNTVTTSNFSQSAYNSYGAPFDAFQTGTMLLNAQCTASDPHTIQLTSGVPGDTTRIVYTKGYYYAGSAWTQYTGTCMGALNGDWCQGSVSATITNPNLSTASAAAPAYLVGMTCSVQGGGWKCGCRDTACSNFYWQVQGAGL